MPETRHSVCALDCPDACSLLIDIDDAGRGSKLRGNPAHPVTRGFLCGKVARYLEREYSPDRLLHPLRRTGAKGSGRFVRIGWDEALDEIAEKLKSIAEEFGPESILPYSYGGTMGYLKAPAWTADSSTASALRGSTDHLLVRRRRGPDRCLGFRYGIEPEQFRHAKLIIAWGANILETNVHLWPFIVEARRNGARFYTIDPHRNRTGKLSDRHYAIARQRRRARARHDARDCFRRSGRSRVGGAAHPRFRRIEGARPRLDAPARCRAHRHSGGRHRPAGARVCQYASRRDPAELWRAAVGTRRHGGSNHRPAASAHRRLEGCRAAACSSPPPAFQVNRAGLERPDLQFASPLGREARIVNMSLLGQALTSSTILR